MTNILLMGLANDRRLHSFLEKSLSSCFKLISLSPKSCLIDSHADFLLWDCGHTDVIQSSHTIIILKQSTGNIPNIKIENAPNPIIVVPSENKEALEFAARCSIPAVTCGLGSKDTFTFSSFVDGEAVVSLQRSVTAFDGTIIEPVEIPVKFNLPTDNYGILSLSAVLAFSGCISKLELIKL